MPFELDEKYKMALCDGLKNENFWEALSALMSLKRSTASSALETVDPHDAVAVARAQKDVNLLDSFMEEFERYRKMRSDPRNS